MGSIMGVTGGLPSTSGTVADGSVGSRGGEEASCCMSDTGGAADEAAKATKRLEVLVSMVLMASLGKKAWTAGAAQVA